MKRRLRLPLTPGQSRLRSSRWNLRVPDDPGTPSALASFFHFRYQFRFTSARPLTITLRPANTCDPLAPLAFWVRRRNFTIFIPDTSLALLTSESRHDLFSFQDPGNHPRHRCAYSVPNTLRRCARRHAGAQRKPERRGPSSGMRDNFLAARNAPSVVEGSGRPHRRARLRSGSARLRIARSNLRSVKPTCIRTEATRKRTAGVR